MHTHNIILYCTDRTVHKTFTTTAVYGDTNCSLGHARVPGPLATVTQY